MQSSPVTNNWAKIGKISGIVLMIMLAIIFIFPIVFMFMSSLKPSEQLLRDSASFRAFMPVGDISLDNYRAMFERAPVWRFLFNSFIVTTITVSLGLFVNSLVAYALALLRWSGSGLVLGIIIATLVVPFEAIAVPLLLIVSKLPTFSTSEGFGFGWINTYHVQIIPFIAQAFIIFLFVQFFKSLPYDLIEAARIDGASWFGIYRKVIVPISGPVFSTAAVLMALPMWNAYLWPIMTVQSEALRPVMVGLSYFFQLNVVWGEVMAFLSFITLPILIFFLLIQRTYIESIAASGIKG
ncbi:MAG: carbohydrate ABC transporter permease [Chloroflexi bacterium]|nr:carbohydrate ABC transporter permease [Chloroflexota bacterium]MBP7043835.1 carbohydrate ABC transporter permease [Chloroflexota bacterium]